MTTDTSRPAVEALIADLRKDAKRDAAHRNEHARATKFNRKTMPSWVSADVLAVLLDERDAARDASVWRDTIDEQRAYIRDLEATHKQDMHAIGQHALAQSVVLDKLRSAEAERDKLTAKLDAVKAALNASYHEPTNRVWHEQMQRLRGILADTDEHTTHEFCDTRLGCILADTDEGGAQ